MAAVKMDGIAMTYVGTYILDKDNNPVPATTLQWGEWLQEDRRRKIVAKTTLNNGYRVSTVFLGLDHNYSDTGPPLLFETMIFPEEGMGELYMERYSTWDKALAGHERICKMKEPYYD